MEPEFWRQIEDLYHRALELDESERADFIKSAAGDNEKLRQEVESLLAREGEAERFIEVPAMAVAARLIGEESENAACGGATDTTSLTANPQGAGSLIGPYHLLQLIGEGGMGQVWLADQKEPVRRRVALKLIKTGMDTREVVARFQSERQALALMDHPAIAKVFDAGSTTEGRPYFVMEYVAGLAITAYCDQHKLNLRQRLQLFILVCEGVQHAHQKGIIHRDLKPSNILVSELDGKPVPRIIDFGVAKAISQQLTPDTLFTYLGSVVGTLGYMSRNRLAQAVTTLTRAATSILWASYSTNCWLDRCRLTFANWPTTKSCTACVNKIRHGPAPRSRHKPMTRQSLLKIEESIRRPWPGNCVAMRMLSRLKPWRRIASAATQLRPVSPPISVATWPTSQSVRDPPVWPTAPENFSDEIAWLLRSQLRWLCPS